MRPSRHWQLAVAAAIVVFQSAAHSAPSRTTAQAVHIHLIHAVAAPWRARLRPGTSYAGTVTTLPTFSSPTLLSVAYDTDDGHLYVLSGRDIYRIESNGQTTHIASVNGNLFPDTLLWDRSTHVFYVSNPSAYEIVQVTPQGATTILAGGTQGTNDGTGTAAQFQFPTGIALDPTAHVLYVADNDRLRRITEAGVVTTVGPSVLTGNGFGQQHGVAFNTHSGALAVTDAPTNSVLAFSPRSATYRPLAGRCLPLAGATSCPPYQLDGVGAGALFGSPATIAYEAGSNAYYLIDGLNFSVRRVYTTGLVVTIAGSGNPASVDGSGVEASFANPTCASLDPKTQTIIVCDQGAIRFVTTRGPVAPPPPHAFAMRPAPTLLSGPSGSAITADGSYWFAEQTAGYMGRRFPSGHILEYTLPPDHDGPHDVALGHDGNVWFADYSNINQFGNPQQTNIVRANLAGSIKAFAFPNLCQSNPNIGVPSSLSFDPAGDLWFDDSCPLAIGYRKPDGTYRQFVSGQVSGIAAGTYTWAAAGSTLDEYTNAGTLFKSYNVPADSGVAFGPNNDIWFLSFASQAVGYLDPSNGNVVSYQLPNCNCFRPLGNLTEGPDGAMWFTEGGLIRSPGYRGAVGRITTTGTYTEYPVFEARSRPSGLAFGPNGALWISDAGASKIGYTFYR